MNRARLKDQACSPNCTVHIPVPAESPVEKTTHHFLITEGSPNSCSIVTALLLHVLVCHLQYVHLIILRLVNTTPPRYL